MIVSDENIGHRFFCVEFGTVTPAEMIVRYTFADGMKKYLVFTACDNDSVCYVREYEGSLSDQRFYPVHDTEIIRLIEAALRNLHNNHNTAAYREINKTSYD